MEPGRPVALLANYHTFGSPVYSVHKGVVWLLVAVVAELTPTVSKFIMRRPPSFIATFHVGTHPLGP